MPTEYKLLYKRKLPHYQPKDSVFFVTFRLSFNLPQAHKTKYIIYKSAVENMGKEHPNNPDLKHDNQKRLFAFYDNLINDVQTNVSLTDNPIIAKVIYDKILSLHNEKYYLYAFTIMPNHVHLLYKPVTVEGIPLPLSQIMHSLKGGTAFDINKLSNRKGRLWMREYFDYMIRSEQELINIIDYIRNNPVKAKLVNVCEDWQWTWLNPDLLS